MPIADFAPMIFLGFIVVIIAAFVLSKMAEERRRRAFADEASRLGLLYEPKGTEDLHRRYPSLDVFRAGRGGRPRCRNVIRGKVRGAEVRCLDFVYTVSTGKSSHDVWRSVALALLPEEWPHLKLVPETLGHKIADAFGADDIDFESEDFSRRFWVKSSDRKLAYDVVHPRMMEFLMTPGWDHWQVEGPVLCLWDDRKMHPSDAAPAIERLLGFLALVPNHARPRTRIPIAVPAP